MTKHIYQLLDVFTDEPFSGNQLAIFEDATQIPEHLLGPIARELNLSETVYLYPASSGSSDMKMRIFTPGKELPTAGHPTIGTALLLSMQQDHGKEKLTLNLEQLIGNIKVEVNEGLATMWQPLPTFGRIYEDRQAMAELVGLNSSDLLDAPIQWVSCGVPYVIIPARSIAEIQKVGFRLDRFHELKDQLDDAFIYVFAPEGERSGSNLHGRMFAPEAGILEDPATGSANGPLGCYVTQHQIARGPFVSEQGFEMGRPSIIHIDIIKGDNGNISEVKVGGQAVRTGCGEIWLPANSE